LLRESILNTCPMVPIRIDMLLGLSLSAMRRSGGVNNKVFEGAQDTRDRPRIFALSIRKESM
jgi:hypothetical protein